MFHVVFFEPRIPPNTGNAIRMVACTGATLHLVEPLGFTLTNTHLRRAGLDYHDLAHVVVHPDFDAVAEVLPGRLFAFTGRAQALHTEVSYLPGDGLLFGPEPDGLPERILADPRVTDRLRIPMIPGTRSLNLSNAAAIATYEAWRQQGFSEGG